MLSKALIYKKMGFNVIPTYGKRPSVAWLEYQNRPPAEDVFANMPWSAKGKEFPGLAAISGYNNISCFDFDKAPRSSIPIALSALSLPQNYPWVVISGSGNGFHIWFKYNKDNNPKDAIILTATCGKYKPIHPGLCHHMEIRLANCYTILPPSKHLSGLEYSFLHVFPSAPPSELTYSTIYKFVTELFTITPKGNPKTVVKKKKEIIENKYNPEIEEVFLLSAANYIAENYPDKNYDLWMRLGYACASIGREGLRFFKIISNNKLYNDTEKFIEDSFWNFYRSYNGDITLGTLYYIAKDLGWEPPFCKFWEEDTKITFNLNMFINYLSKQDFAKLTTKTDYDFIYKDKVFINIIQIFHIKDFVVNYIKYLDQSYFNTPKSRSKILSAIIASHTLLRKETLEFLPSVNLNILRDTKEISYMFFKNCYLSITKKEIKVNDYTEFKGYIFSENVIDFNYAPKTKKAVFSDFIQYICKEDPERIANMTTAIGYLLTTYKDPANSKAIIFSDENIDSTSSGRSGKSLLAKALSKIRSTIEIPGKSFSENDRFIFQSVRQSTNIICLNDVEKHFPFEFLFNAITDDLKIEQKGRTAKTIPFAVSPKFLVITNYAIVNNDNSSVARQHIVSFTDFFNINHTPLDVFGHRFFDEWDTEEWNAFYNYMAEAIQSYLIYGLIDYSDDHILYRKALLSTSQDFLDFVDKYIEKNKLYDKKELLNNFLEFTDSKKVSANLFTRWCNSYASIYKLILAHIKPWGKSPRMIGFYTSDKISEIETD